METVTNGLMLLQLASLGFMVGTLWGTPDRATIAIYANVACMVAVLYIHGFNL